MRILGESNVFRRLSQPTDPQHSIAARAVKSLRGEGHELRIVPQILYEYWVVATRPVNQNGLGVSGAEAHLRLTNIKSFFTPLRDERGILERWEQIVLDHRVRGKAAHDARLVAAMLRHGLTHLLTFDDAAFKRYTMIETLRPTDALPAK